LFTHSHDWKNDPKLAITQSAMEDHHNEELPNAI